LLGYVQDSFALIWDSAKDELIRYKSNAQPAYPRGVPFARFVEELFAPAPAPDELPDLWVTALRQLDSPELTLALPAFSVRTSFEFGRL
jgi:hypothetical protein